MEHIGDWHAAAASTLDWWREAGVDILVEDHPRDWLARAAPPAPPAEPLPAATALPATLAEFLAWRTSDAAPEASWRGATIAATGPLDASLMVLVDCPDKDDRDGLLGGAAGKLFDRMLAAIGLTRGEVHLSAVCAKRPVAGRMPAEVQAELHRLAQHHVGLLAPRRLLLMGDAAARALTGVEVLRARGGLHAIKHDRGEAAAIATFHPRLLLERPAQKADAWKDLQLLMSAR
ncbi:MAG: uracil-DNA glycosylase [Sphingomonas bacterium]|uniref:uracil-DNA glycosylase n=1 Tax=Sphingomonas bacterium TaxID=1895847 RepID=UPI0026398734|nr:uracil-DNA glycosylase [Sphingomonas bacterium]MDB5695590.1 uracil-DNA glycosylase [Sphingomonas bacterium]